MIYLKTDEEIELLRESNLLVGKTLGEIAKWIEYAARINLSEMKKSARKAIEKKCNYDNYVKYWINNVLQF